MLPLDRPVKIFHDGQDPTILVDFGRPSREPERCTSESHLSSCLGQIYQYLTCSWQRTCLPPHFYRKSAIHIWYQVTYCMRVPTNWRKQESVYLATLLTICTWIEALLMEFERYRQGYTCFVRCSSVHEYQENRRVKQRDAGRRGLRGERRGVRRNHTERHGVEDTPEASEEVLTCVVPWPIPIRHVCRLSC